MYTRHTQAYTDCTWFNLTYMYMYKMYINHIPSGAVDLPMHCYTDSTFSETTVYSEHVHAIDTCTLGLHYDEG